MTAEDVRYRRLRDQGRYSARPQIESALARGPQRFGELWPGILEITHLRLRDLSDLVMEMSKEQVLVVEGMRARERKLKDKHVLRAVQ